MTVYAIATITIHDPERYAVYGAGFMEVFSQHAGQMLSVDDAPVVLEGEWPHTRTVLIAFPDAEAMAAWWNSPEYRTLAEHRHAASIANIAMVQGRG
jgi:uncharacterized protein (DUF1330 family)